MGGNAPASRAAPASPTHTVRASQRISFPQAPRRPQPTAHSPQPSRAPHPLTAGGGGHSKTNSDAEVRGGWRQKRLICSPALVNFRNQRGRLILQITTTERRPRNLGHFFALGGSLVGYQLLLIFVPASWSCNHVIQKTGQDLLVTHNESFKLEEKSLFFRKE